MRRHFLPPSPLLLGPPFALTRMWIPQPGYPALHPLVYYKGSQCFFSTVFYSIFIPLVIRKDSLFRAAAAAKPWKKPLATYQSIAMRRVQNSYLQNINNWLSLNITIKQEKQWPKQLNR